MIIFCLLLVVAPVKHKEFLYNGRKVSIKSKQSILASKSSWYFINYEELPKSPILSSLNIEINPKNYITANWIRLFLSTEQAVELSSSTKNIMMLPLNGSDKSFDITTGNTRFYAEFHESFNPSEYTLKNTTYKNLLSTMYEVFTTDVDYLLSIPELLFICDAPFNKFHNRWGVGLIQSFGPPRMTPYGFRGPRYLEERGISGQDQVITVVDGGLDVSNSFFYDKDHPFVYDELNPDHRKVIYYDTYGNKYDSKANGHGTHTCGTAAGKSMCGNQQTLYDGSAPDAKIHFIDIGQNDESRSLISYPITLLSSEMGLTKSYVTSNSWGSSSRNYGQTRLYDMAANYMRDRLFVFSAGNNGDKGYITVNSPGDSKNVLTIGALGNSYGQLFDSITRSVSLIGDNMKHYTLSQRIGTSVFDTTIGIYQHPTSTVSESGKVYLTSNPSDICSASPTPYAAILASMSSFSCRPNFPVYSTTGNPSEILNLKNVTISISITPDYFKPGINEYSSLGPSYFGILKPDIVAPGTDIKSAQSSDPGATPGHGCDELSEKSGTSMACPNVGGLATLVYQYFLDGYYPTGKKNTADSFVIGSALARAIIIASAQRMTDTWMPSFVFGHGIANIENVLTFDHTLKVFKDIKINQDEEKIIKFNVKSASKPLRIAMAYLDEPDQTESLILFIDIDMFLVTPSKKIIYGNQRPGNQEEHLSTAEKIVLETNLVEVGEYELHFVGNGKISSTMRKYALFSLCVVGPFEADDQSSFSNWESKTPKTCEFPFVGVNCQIEAIEINNESDSFKLREDQESYIYYQVPPNWTNVTIAVRRPTTARGRVVYQFSSTGIYLASHLYEKTYSSGEPVYHIKFERKSFKNRTHQILCARILNLSPSSYSMEFEFNYDIYVPPVPTASTPPATWKDLYVAGVATGYSLFGVTFVAMIILIFAFCSKKKALDFKMEQIGGIV